MPQLPLPILLAPPISLKYPPVFVPSSPTIDSADARQRSPQHLQPNVSPMQLFSGLIRRCRTTPVWGHILEPSQKKKSFLVIQGNSPMHWQARQEKLGAILSQY